MSNTINLKYHRRILSSISNLRGRGRMYGNSPAEGSNCLKPNRGDATKAELMELHRDEMRERFKRQFTRTPTHRLRSINENPYRAEYHGKSIWPDGKTVKPGRMLNARG